MTQERYDYQLKTAFGTGTALYTNIDTINEQDLAVWLETSEYSLPGRMFTFGHPLEPFLHRVATKQMAIFITQRILQKLSQDLPQLELSGIVCSIINDIPGGYLVAVELKQTQAIHQHFFPTKQ